MTAKKRKPSIWERLRMSKARAIKSAGVAHGKKVASKKITALISKAKEEEAKEWKTRVDDTQRNRATDRTHFLTEVQGMMDTIKDMRDSHAKQIKLIRQIYHNKSSETERLSAKLRDRLEDVDRRHFEINDFLSRYIARVEQIHAKQEMKIVENSADVIMLRSLREMQNDFGKLSSGAHKMTTVSRPGVN